MGPYGTNLTSVSILKDLQVLSHYSNSTGVTQGVGKVKISQSKKIKCVGSLSGVEGFDVLKPLSSNTDRSGQ